MLKKYWKKHYNIHLFSLVVFLVFIKLLSMSFKFEKKNEISILPRYIYADHSPLKIFPKASNSKSLEINQNAYDFIQQKNWKINKKVKSNQQGKKTPVFKKRVTSNEKISEKNSIYKDNKIRIVKSKESKSTNINSKYMVQLGAFYSYDSAEQEWYRIQKDLFRFLKNHDFHIEQTKISSDKILYRLKAGPFSSHTRARSFCNNLRKKSIECFLSIK